MAIHWDDGLRGQERSLRHRRDAAIRQLIRARRAHATTIVGLALAASLVLYASALLLLVTTDETLCTVGLAVGTAAMLFFKRFRRVARNSVRENRAALADVQIEYDAAFFALAVEEHGRPIDELLTPPPPVNVGVVVPDPPPSPASRRDAERRRERAEMDRNFKAMEPALRPATPDDYRRWLGAFLERGAGSTRIDYVDRPMPTSRWYVATRPMTVRPLYGASAIQIIVPPGVTVNVPYERTGATGHSTLYRPDGSTLGFHNHPASSVSIFTDTQVDP